MNPIKTALTILFHHKLIEEAEALEKIADTCKCGNCQEYRGTVTGRCPLCGLPGSGPCSACGWTGEIKYGESCL